MSNNLFVIAKQFDEIGCVAYCFKSTKEAVSLPDVLDELAGEGMQIVMVNRPDIYMEYAPYNYVDSMQEILNYVTDRSAGQCSSKYDLKKLETLYLDI